MRVKTSGTVGSGAFGFGFSCANAGRMDEHRKAPMTSAFDVVRIVVTARVEFKCLMFVGS